MPTAAARPKPKARSVARKPTVKTDDGEREQTRRLAALGLTLNTEASGRFLALPPAERMRRLAGFRAKVRQALDGMTFDQWLDEHHRIEDGGEGLGS